MRQLALEALERVDLVLHLHPAPEAPGARLRTLAGSTTPSRRPLLTVYTKGDLLSAPPPRRARALGARRVRDRRGNDSPALLARIREHLPEREFAHDPDDVGTQPVRFFVVEYLREAAFELLEDELPYGFTAEVEEFREAERPVYIRVTLFVERESQKGIVIGAGGATIKAIGAHARRRMEELIGAPVYLDCWVKTLPNWRKSSAALTRFGFPARQGDPMTLAPELLQILVCPKCKGELEYRESPEALVCHACRLVYPVEDGIPIMLIDEAKPL